MGSGNRRLQGRPGCNQLGNTDNDLAALRQPVTRPSIEAITALDGKIFAMLTPGEQATLLKTMGPQRAS